MIDDFVILPSHAASLFAVFLLRLYLPEAE
jgi:hypothetical protein